MPYLTRSVCIDEEIIERRQGKMKLRASVESRGPYPPLSRSSTRFNAERALNAEPDVSTSDGKLSPTLVAWPVPSRRRRSSSQSLIIEHIIRFNTALPTREDFAALEEQYLTSLNVRKQSKALISQDMFDKVWLVLHYPKESTIGTPQFRWWVRKMFALANPDELEDADAAGQAQLGELVYPESEVEMGSLPVVVHEGKRVAIREQIYDILCACHERINHGGRDRTGVEVRKTYTWIPKDLIALFVKNCPTCVRKRAGLDGREAEEAKDTLNTPGMSRSGTGSCDSGTEAGLLIGHASSGRSQTVAQYVPLPMNNLILDPQRGGYVASVARTLSSGPLPPAHAHPQSALGASEVHYMRSSTPDISPAHYYDISSSGSSGLPASSEPDSCDTPTCGSYDPSQAPRWRFPPPSTLPSGGHFYTPDDGVTSQHAQHQYYDFVRLPSINVQGGNSESRSAHTANPAHPKVTLPPLSQVLSGGLTTVHLPLPRAFCGPPTTFGTTRVRQPLQALTNNVANFAQLQNGFAARHGGSLAHVPGKVVPAQHGAQAGAVGCVSVSQIDPALLASTGHGGVHMLALAAKVSEGRSG